MIDLTVKQTPDEPLKMPCCPKSWLQPRV